MQKNLVIFKGRRDGIVVALDDKIDFKTLKEALTEKVADARRFFMDGKTSVTFTGRKLTEIEEDELLTIISRHIELTYVGDTDAKPVHTKPVLESAQNMTLFHKGSLRSGQSISYNGSVVLIGDVNPGGQIIADGNIVVLGALKGLAHAGAGGNTGCFVSALNFSPTQLRIADMITFIPKEMKSGSKMKQPLYAFIHEGQIYISPLEN